MKRFNHVLFFIPLICSGCNSSHSGFEQYNKWNNYEDMIAYYKSDHNLDERKFSFIDLSGAIEGKRTYRVNGIDACSSHERNCVHDYEINDHYLHSCHFYEHCELTFSYYAIKDDRPLDQYDYCCEYYLQFFEEKPVDDVPSLSLEPYHGDYFDPIDRNNNAYMKMFYNLKYNDSILLKIELWGIPNKTEDDFEEEAYRLTMDKLDDVKNKILDIYKTKCLEDINV